MSSKDQGDLIRAHVLDLDAVDVGEGRYVPLRVELFSGATLVRVRARVRPVISWIDLVSHLFDVLHRHPTGSLPLDALRYTLIDMHTRELFPPVGLVGETYSDHLLGIDQAEFVGALDRRRRMCLVADALRALPWPPHPSDDEPRHLHAAADESAETEGGSGREQVDLDVVVDEPALPAAESVDEAPGEGSAGASGGAWSQWHRTYAGPADDSRVPQAGR